jgi:tRNA-(ms[2]io[6]A)-hydroxylase
MLCLKVPSQPSWIEVATTDLERVLLDHAHCEKKAAVNAMSLVSRYPGRETLVRRMIELAQEEMEHFGAVYDFIRRRGIDLERDPGDPYVQALHKQARQNEPGRMLDLLLIAALVEARSCERFSILSQHVPDEELREFYRSLLASEAGHYRMFFDIAREYYPEEEVRERLDELSTKEAEIVLALHNEASMHG